MTVQNPKFGRLLRDARLRRGLSLEAAGEQLGVRHTVFRSWERGEARPTARYLGQVAIWLGIPIHLLLLAMDAVTTEEARAIAKLRVAP